ncbi:8d3dd454-908f-4782-82a0-0615c944ffe8 [Thermothielavioides terrestris]|uniref:8d3dd454-908f-4782-82a0-0615c944ffe8 n=1 Tax=Thermothielavioides terrestris TaxID=2587410 RepID=A0A446BCI0_9PEZI|nr:8d3dd454-908f-4782-82a0-0615c944ffe8 [Thermothielavioides terrestris]
MATADVDAGLSSEQYPMAADLRKMARTHPLPMVPPGTVDLSAMAGDQATKQARTVLDALLAALTAMMLTLVANCFFPGQAYWKDSLALTRHLRTCTGFSVIAAALLQTKNLRETAGEIKLEDAAQFIPVTPVLSSTGDKRTMYAYNLGIEAADRQFVPLPTWVEAQLIHGGLSHRVSQEPDRHAALAAAGFPDLDSRHPDAVMAHHFFERAGGHYIDTGATGLVAEEKVSLRVGVQPETGLRFSDGSTVD